MVTFPKSIMSILGMLFSLILTALSSFNSPTTSVKTELPEIPDDFQPVVQFTVASDSHNRNDRVEEMLYTSRAAVDGTNYDKIDAALLAGDFTDAGKSEEITAFYNAFSAACGSDTEPIVCLGNHELKTEDVFNRYKSITGWDVDIHKVINGVHFIAISYDENVAFGTEKQSWLRKQLREAEADNPDMPIIVIQHPHPTGTVYGSVNWSNPQLNLIYNEFPQTIVFSGHSHYPINDPRSIWQGGFTAAGCGGLKYYELELDLSAGQFPEEEESAGNYWLVGIDRNGSVSMRAYDVVSGGFYENTNYYIKDAFDKSSYVYTYQNMESIDAAPVFPENAVVTASVNDSGNTVVTFTAATDKFVVHDYKISVKAGLKEVFSASALSDYYYVNEPDTYSFDVGALTSGTEYSVTITATNSFYKVSQPLTYTFTA